MPHGPSTTSFATPWRSRTLRVHRSELCRRSSRFRHQARTSWYGVDDDGQLVPAGEFFVKITATYLKRHSGNGHEVIRESVASSAQRVVVAEVVPFIECVANYGPGYSAALIGYDNPVTAVTEVVTLRPDTRNEFAGEPPTPRPLASSRG